MEKLTLTVALGRITKQGFSVVFVCSFVFGFVFWSCLPMVYSPRASWENGQCF